MAMNSGWRLFTSSLKVRGSPTLLIKHETAISNGGRVLRLNVCITDLTYLWSETLERKELIRKACDTSIDPDQLDTLLEYLNKGLNFAPRTTLSLRSERGRSHLVLHLKSPLPEPLRPLEWDFDLRQASELDFTKEFILPLIGNLYRGRSAISDLEAIISNKDKAIERISNELQTRNVRITGLFDKRFYGDNVAEKHKKGILMNKIPGLRPFGAEKWQEDTREQILPKLKDQTKELFEYGLESRSISDLLSQEAWWEDLGNGVEVEEPSQISQPVIIHRGSTSAFESSQAIGNGSRDGHDQYGNSQGRSPKSKGTRPVNDDNVEIESDATASTTSDLESPAPNPPSRRIGKIGCNRGDYDQTERLDTVLPPNDRSGSGSMDVDAISSRQPGGIGRIGGVKAMHGAEPNSSARLSQIERLPTRPISDTIGEDKRPTDSSRNGKPSETAEERAHRHRAMLKHDLEEKRKIPVKKKRKF